MARLAGAAVAVAAAVACTAILLALGGGYEPAMQEPIPDAPVRPTFDRSALLADLDQANLTLGQPVFIRIFKQERVLEVWMDDADDGFRPFKSYEICRFSGEPGPKLAEGDMQAPEGFYRVGARQLNPASRHHLAFNLGFPNVYDRQLGRTGSALMVHGGCSSTGCYAITDEGVDEVYALVDAALAAGQAAVDVHIFPFRLTAAALAAVEGHRWAPFWANLKEGFDRFEQEGIPPRVGACDGRYVFGDNRLPADCEAVLPWPT